MSLHVGFDSAKHTRTNSRPDRTGCKHVFTVTQAAYMYMIELSIGRLYEHHMVPVDV
mgnify:CR=1 FL=1